MKACKFAVGMLAVVVFLSCVAPAHAQPGGDPAQGGTPAQWGLPNKIGGYRIRNLGPLPGTNYVAYSALLVYGTPGGKLYVRTATTLASPASSPDQVAAFFNWDAFYFTWLYQVYYPLVAQGRQVFANTLQKTWLANHPMPAI